MPIEASTVSGLPGRASGLWGFSSNLTMRRFSSTCITPKLRAWLFGTPMQPTVTSTSFSTCAASIGP